MVTWLQFATSDSCKCLVKEVDNLTEKVGDLESERDDAWQSVGTLQAAVLNAVQQQQLSHQRSQNVSLYKKHE